MKAYQLIAVILGVGVIVLLGFYALFGLVLVGSDVASYSSEGVVVAGLEYDDVLANADAAGYTVERVGSSGFHPQGIDELDAELGPEYAVFRVIFEYDADSRMWATIYANEGVTEVRFFADDLREPFTEAHLPPDDWVIEQFVLAFDVDETTAEAYLDELTDDIRTTDPSTPGASTPTITVGESVDFAAVHDEFTSRATDVTASATDGSGWHERRYYVDDTRIGGVDFVVERVVIEHRTDGHTFSVHVDRLGGVNAGVESHPSRIYEEDEVRAVVREMFVDMGIPPDTVDRLAFEYRGSVW